MDEFATKPTGRGQPGQRPTKRIGKVSRRTTSAKRAASKRIAKKKAARKQVRKTPKLTKKQILVWADAHHRRTGKWPGVESGLIVGAAGETWDGVRCALRKGSRGLPGGSSLARLIAEHRRIPYDIRWTKGRNLSNKQLLSWIKAHHKRTGRWPIGRGGPIVGVKNETWTGVDLALRVGFRGLPGGSSLAKLIGKRHGSVRNLNSRRLTQKQILAWADAHHRLTGRWPISTIGQVLHGHGETWMGIHAALRYGSRGLRGGSSLARLLLKYRGVKLHRRNTTKLSQKQILAWADAHYRRTGKWPKERSGPVLDAPNETWLGLKHAVSRGKRGLPGGITLPGLLAKHRGVRNKNALPRFHKGKILSWADAHHRRTGGWPNVSTGPIPEAPGETWSAVACAMYRGARGMSGKITLAGMLMEHRGVRCRNYLPKLTEKEVMLWAKAHCRRTGDWPTMYSGPVDDAPGESWAAVNSALRRGHRGLPEGPSLAQLLAGRPKPKAMRLFAGRRKPVKRIIG